MENLTASQMKEKGLKCCANCTKVNNCGGSTRSTQLVISCKCHKYKQNC